MESPASVLLCGFGGEKGEHGTVTEYDWMHIVNKHPSLSLPPSQTNPLPQPHSQTLSKDVPSNISSALAV